MEAVEFKSRRPDYLQSRCPFWGRFYRDCAGDT